MKQTILSLLLTLIISTLEVTITNHSNASAAIRVPLQVVPFCSWNGWDADAKPTGTADCAFVLGMPTGQPYGDPGINNYADLTNYDKLVVEMADGTPRFIFNRDVDEGQWNADEALSHLIDNTQNGWSLKYFSQEGNTWTVDLKLMTKEKGFAHLHAIKGANWSNVTVLSMELLQTGDVVEIDGIYYNLIPKGKVAEVTKGTNQYSGDIAIPETVEYGNEVYNVTKICSNTFAENYNIKSITIPKSIKTIGEAAFLYFSENNNFKRINITDLDSWCKIKYEGETYLTPPLATANHLYLNGEEIIDLVIPNTVDIISSRAFYGGAFIKTITIPNSVNTIGEKAFYGCSGLTSVTIPSSVTSIGGSAFSGCIGLNSMIIPNSITSIGDNAFYGCSGLTSVTIPNSITSIGSAAFSGCSSLTSVHISDISTWCGIIFESNPLSYAHHLYIGNEEVKDLVIPNTVNKISSNAFSGCSGLTSVTIPNSVTLVGKNSFQNCTGLTSLTIGNSVTHVYDGAFSGCTGLTTLAIPNSVTSIGASAFSGCSNLTQVSIGSGVRNIYDYAFYNCADLTDVYCYVENCDDTNGYNSAIYTCSNAFNGSYIDYATLHVPSSSIDLYKNTTPWSSFGTIVGLTDTNNFFEMTVKVNNAHGTVTYGESLLTDGTQTFNVKEETDAVLTLTPNEGYKLASVTVDGVDKTADVVDGVLTISNVTADLTVNVSFITAGETAAVTIGGTGMATYCAAKDLDFSEVDELTAYTGAGFNRETGVLTMLKVTDAPAGTGLVLTGSEGTYEVPVKTSASVYANLLVGVMEETTLSQTDGGYVNYILGNGSHGTGFYIVSGEGQLAAGKAYLRLPAVVAGESRAIGITFADDATGIEGISGDSKTTTDEWRDLQGRRIMQPTKAGIYLKDGRKIVVR